jgi:hypothetical protein
MYNSNNKESYDETLRNQKNETFNAKETRKLEYYKNKAITQYKQQQQQRKQTQIPKINNKQRTLNKKEFLPN